MKRSILNAFLIIATFPLLLTAQNEKKYKITTTVEKEYINLEINEWKEINNEWFYKGQKTGLSPISFTCIITTIQTIEEDDKVIQSSCTKESKSLSGHYISDESDWIWNEKESSWYYKSDKTKMYPKSFTKIATEIIKKSDCIGNNYENTTIEIEEIYHIEPLWTWSSENNSWLYMDKMTEDFPKYHIGKSVRKESTNVIISDNY